jgi:Holliday junction resolvase RusA-like endonuclease
LTSDNTTPHQKPASTGLYGAYRAIFSEGQALIVSLPLPPSTNNIYFTNRRGGRTLTPQAHAFKQGVALALAGLRRPDWAAKPGPLAAFLLADIDRRRDLANVEKLVLDAVCSWLGIDDRWVDLIILARAPVQGLVVMVLPLLPPV